MKKIKINKRNEWFFNIEIIKVDGCKEIKVSNMPLNRLRLVSDELLEKYG